VVDISETGNRTVIDPSVIEEIVAICLEAMINVRRHAEAKHIAVSIAFNRFQLIIAVRDDGKGIDPQTLKRRQFEGHFGLLGMRERAKRIRSKLEIGAEPGGGTLVRIVVPAYAAYRGGLFGRFWTRSVVIPSSIAP
jgi:signal transduction histidine kinase